MSGVLATTPDLDLSRGYREGPTFKTGGLHISGLVGSSGLRLVAFLPCRPTTEYFGPTIRTLGELVPPCFERLLGQTKQYR